MSKTAQASIQGSFEFANPPAPVNPENAVGCFSGEARVITREGVAEIADLSGGFHELMGPHGRWVKSEVRSFGVQPLVAVTVARNKIRKVIHATDDLRWLIRHNRLRSQGGGMKIYPRLTGNLKPGARLMYSFPNRPTSTVISPYGVAAGLVFGDGTRTGDEARIDLYGASTELASYFGPIQAQLVIDPKCGPSMPVLRVRYLPRSFKGFPRLDEGHSFLLGWLAGYFAADGCVSESGDPRLASVSQANLEFVREVCTRIGVGTFGVSESATRQGDFGDIQMYSLGLMASTLKPEFFLLAKHRDRFTASLPRARERRGWTVESVTDAGRAAEVFGAVVPVVDAFTLEDNILFGARSERHTAFT